MNKRLVVVIVGRDDGATRLFKDGAIGEQHMSCRIRGASTAYGVALRFGQRYTAGWLVDVHEKRGCLQWRMDRCS